LAGTKLVRFLTEAFISTQYAKVEQKQPEHHWLQ